MIDSDLMGIVLSEDDIDLAESNGWAAVQEQLDLFDEHDYDNDDECYDR